MVAESDSDLRPMRPTAAAAALVEQADYPLYVVTAAADGVRSGCLVGFVTQASIEPARFIVCMSTVNHTTDVVARSNGLALHALGACQHQLASLFGEESGDWTDKFGDVSWTEGVTGAPILSDCAAWLEGLVIGTMPAGDHRALLVEPVDGAAGGCRGHLFLSDAADISAGHPA